MFPGSLLSSPELSLSNSFFCALGGHLGSGRISQGDTYPGWLGTHGTSESVGEACEVDGLASARSSAAGGLSAESGPSGSSEVDGPVDEGCSSGFGLSDNRQKVQKLPQGKYLCYIPVDLNPEVIFGGVKKASFTNSAIW